MTLCIYPVRDIQVVPCIYSLGKCFALGTHLFRCLDRHVVSPETVGFSQPQATNRLCHSFQVVDTIKLEKRMYVVCSDGVTSLLIGQPRMRQFVRHHGVGAISPSLLPHSLACEKRPHVKEMFSTLPNGPYVTLVFTLT